MKGPAASWDCPACASLHTSPKDIWNRTSRPLPNHDCRSAIQLRVGFVYKLVPVASARTGPHPIYPPGFDRPSEYTMACDPRFCFQSIQVGRWLRLG
jgi:hypothetical protein